MKLGPGNARRDSEHGWLREISTVPPGALRQGRAVEGVARAQARILCTGFATRRRSQREERRAYRGTRIGVFALLFAELNVTIMVTTAPSKAEAMSFCASHSSPCVPR